MKFAKLGVGLLLTTTSYYAISNEKNRVFVWGNGFYQAVPGQGLSFNNFTPKKIDDLEDKKITQLFLNEYFESGITQNGEAIIWDAHKLQSQADDEINDSKRNNVIKLNNPSKGKVQCIQYTKQFVWTLTSNGEVYQYPIKEQKIVNTPKKIQSLQNIKQIATGEDHFVALTNAGTVYTMGDDTLGQCGLGPNNRSSAPPFYEQRHRNPQQLQNLPEISKIVCGDNHTIALSNEGAVYGWGSNTQMQLSHLEDFSKVAEPLIVVYNPIRVSALMDSNNQVLDAAAGEEFSVFVTKNKMNQEIEVFSCGHNIRGQLGAGFVRHISDIIKVEGLSNFKIEKNGKPENVEIKQIQCGRNHCMALTNVGAILEWGDNEYGQMGNKKRSFADKPIVVSQFVKDKVISIACGGNSSGVILQ